MDIMPLKKNIRRIKALFFTLRYPHLAIEGLKNILGTSYYKGMLKKSKIENKSLDQIVNLYNEIRLLNFDVRCGNVSHFELLTIASMVATQKPHVLLEIGTFDGNTTLQMALNAPDTAIVHTLDLPSEVTSLVQPILEVDLKLVRDKQKKQRKYQKTSCEKKINQHIGDSAAYDFKAFCREGLVDFAFIDGGHSYECVRSDTENVMKILAPTAIVMWHDFTPDFQGVFAYLNEISSTYPLIHITGTNLVYYKKQQ